MNFGDMKKLLNNLCTMEFNELKYLIESNDSTISFEQDKQNLMYRNHPGKPVFKGFMTINYNNVHLEGYIIGVEYIEETREIDYSKCALIKYSALNKFAYINVEHYKYLDIKD